MKVVLLLPHLLEASDYRGFLDILYKKNKELNSTFSYAFMAQRCKFSSKSFLKEVIVGKKNLSLESTYKIIEGLGFPSTLGRYFFYLVVNGEKISLAEKINPLQELQRYRTKLQRQKVSFSQDRGSNLFQIVNWPFVYAALGDQKNGATFSEIQKRTGFKEQDIQLTLERLVTEKMVVQNGGIYCATSDTVFFENLKKNKFFKNFYTQSVERLYRKARTNFDSLDSLYFSMAISVDHRKMPEFKKSLASLLDEYTEEIEDPQGSRVALLTCGFHLT